MRAKNAATAAAVDVAASLHSVNRFNAIIIEPAARATAHETGGAYATRVLSARARALATRRTTRARILAATD